LTFQGWKHKKDRLVFFDFMQSENPIEDGSMTYYKHLFAPITIGNMTAKNRLLMSAMSINFGVDTEGRVNDQLTQYFVARAKGGCGLMLVGGGAVHPTGLELPQLPMLWDDGCIPALTEMVTAVKPYGAKFGMQLMHGGRQSYHDQKVAPSPIPAPAVVKGVPEELTVDRIQEITASFGDAARRCREAGFDFIEIHGAHGYLVNQFLAPNANHRQDQYGGSFENRARFLLELFADIRAKAGEDFPVGMRINGNDYIHGGFEIEEAKKLARRLEAEGAAYLHVSAGVYGSTQLTIPSMYVEHGCFVALAEEIKREVAIPVVAVGRIKTAEMANRVIGQGRADMVAMGRSLLADPQLADKSSTGRINEIRPCIGCCLGCIHAVLALEPGGCVVNPDVGREYLLQSDAAASEPKRVLVVGSGPAGLAAARMTARRGHKVTVCEENGQMGGVARLAGLPPGRGEIGDIVRYFIHELSRLKVAVRLNTPMSQDLLASLSPDEVVLASGSLPDMPIVRGLFTTQMDLCTVIDLLEGEATPGEKVIVLGGGQAGLVTADYLAEMGSEVVVLNRKRHYAEEMSSNDRFYLRERLKRDTVKLFKAVNLKKVTPDGVIFICQGQTITLKGFDTIVLAEGMQSIRKPAEILKKSAIPVHIIGDAKSPRTLMLAISEGEEIGREI
jgi:2,4-dienoyl-CoA reductase-like NADH-dependent reductase (Old Yellow Enzyme family)/thioredoxin reductase